MQVPSETPGCFRNTGHTARQECSRNTPRDADLTPGPICTEMRQGHLEHTPPKTLPSTEVGPGAPARARGEVSLSICHFSFIPCLGFAESRACPAAEQEQTRAETQAASPRTLNPLNAHWGTFSFSAGVSGRVTPSVRSGPRCAKVVGVLSGQGTYKNQPTPGR